MIDLFPLVRPLIHSMDPEAAHDLTIRCLKLGLTGVFARGQDDPVLKTSVFGLNFPNPVGLAAGFDKNAEAIAGAFKMGFGFAEAGTVTPKPQAGNPKPRLFRLTEDRAVINRFGFNNKGLEAFAGRLNNLTRGGIVGANVGANKDSDDRTADYVTGIDRLYGLSDYFTVNISSPNTPGLRALQSRKALEDLIVRVLEVRDRKMASGERRVPIVVKIAPDLSEEDVADIVFVARETAIDGLIVSNTTIERPKTLKSVHAGEAGGLSGTPLMDRSTRLLANIYRETEGKLPLIGVGGIQSGADAFAKICAGASLVQIYSMLVFEGPGLVTRVKTELAACLKEAGFSNLRDAVGSAVK